MSRAVSRAVIQYGMYMPPVDMAAELRARCAVVTKPGDPGGYRGEYDCGDCCSMTHCETHGKDEGTYPFDEAPVYGGADASLDRGPATDIDARLLPSFRYGTELR